LILVTFNIIHEEKTPKKDGCSKIID